MCRENNIKTNLKETQGFIQIADIQGKKMESNSSSQERFLGVEDRHGSILFDAIFKREVIK